MKELLQKLLTKKNLLGLMLFAAPVIGFTVSPDAADALSEHIAGLAQAIMDMLPEEVPAE